jgi:hypothetical protein
MSGLTRKQVYVDRNLSVVLGVGEGELVSYADIQKRLHKYIKDNDLRNPQIPRVAPAVAPSLPVQDADIGSIKRCRDCGAEIPSVAVFCDLCGVQQ